MSGRENELRPVGQGSEPNARLMCRKKRDASRGSPGFVAAQRTLARNDNQTHSVQGAAVGIGWPTVILKILMLLPNESKCRSRNSAKCLRKSSGRKIPHPI